MESIRLRNDSRSLLKTSSFRSYHCSSAPRLQSWEQSGVFRCWGHDSPLVHIIEHHESRQDVYRGRVAASTRAGRPCTVTTWIACSRAAPNSSAVWTGPSAYHPMERANFSTSSEWCIRSTGWKLNNAGTVQVSTRLFASWGTGPEGRRFSMMCMIGRRCGDFVERTNR